jgi:hypothetical protein
MFSLADFYPLGIEPALKNRFLLPGIVLVFSKVTRAAIV